MSLADKLQKIAAQRGVKARVGILEDKTYPDGAGVAEVGYMNEYGTDTIPPRPFFRKAVADFTGLAGFTGLADFTGLAGFGGKAAVFFGAAFLGTRGTGGATGISLPLPSSPFPFPAPA